MFRRLAGGARAARRLTRPTMPPPPLPPTPPTPTPPTPPHPPFPPSGEDPLLHIFDEFDTDHDGRLNGTDVAAALQSRRVRLSPADAQAFVDDIDATGTIGRAQFGALVYALAAADLRHYEQGGGAEESAF